MRFWDSSAVVPLVIEETSTRVMQAEFDGDPDLLVWWGTEVECVSALARRERDGFLAGVALAGSLLRLDALSTEWREVQPAGRIRQIAIRLLRVHTLRAGDALQLAAAIVASEEQPAILPFVTLDDRLGQAAEREGFTVVRPNRAV